MKHVADLSAREVLLLAISIEDRNEKIYREYASIFKDYDGSAAAVFIAMADEERDHGDRLRELYKQKYGGAPTRAEAEAIGDVVEAVESPVVTDAEAMIHDTMNAREAFHVSKIAEEKAQRFYEDQARTAKDPEFRAMCQELADIEKRHHEHAEAHEKEYFNKGGKP